jgi:dTDP-4-dehydrorhamnose 3,5-epimerase
MQIAATEIPDVKVITPVRHGDERGFFSETFNARALKEQGLETDFVQDNHVLNGAAGTVRGLHLQTDPSPQGKLIRVTHGGIVDVAVDVRADSPTYGRHVARELTAENWQQLWIPPGFAHGYCTLSAGTEVIYKVTGFYNPDAERGLPWNDPDLGIDWPDCANPESLSGRDREWLPFAKFEGI